MSKQAAIVDECPDPRKRWPLTDAEVFALMQAFTRDKSVITEEDALTLCKWAQSQKFGAYVLHLVLEGYVTVSVEAGAVKVGPLAPYLPDMR